MYVFRASQYIVRHDAKGGRCRREGEGGQAVSLSSRSTCCPVSGRHHCLFAYSLCVMTSPIFNHRHHSRQGGLSQTLS